MFAMVDPVKEMPAKTLQSMTAESLPSPFSFHARRVGSLVSAEQLCHRALTTFSIAFCHILFSQSRHS